MVASDAALPATGAAIASAGLTKRFGPLAAVDDVDLHVPTGSVYGFLGPNGSGKTTTIRMLLGLVLPTSGHHDLLGQDFSRNSAKSLERVGALIEGPAFHPYLSGRRNLARLDAVDRTTTPRTAKARIGEALERVGLTAAADKRYRAYSLGMRQRLGIAAALLRPRDLLVLDEPTNGLDPQGTREIRLLVGHLAAQGVTVFVSSHLLSEVEQMCSDIGVMSAGRLVWQGSMTDLRDRRAANVRVDTADASGAQQAVGVLTEHGVLRPHVEPDSDTSVVGVLGAIEPEPLVAALVAAGVGVRGFAVERPGLEELFVSLTGDGFDVSG